MLRRVRQYIKENQLIAEGDTILVALSGGADSIALTDVLLRMGISIIAAHCNFHLRGQESDRDEQFVRTFCTNRNITLVTTEFATKEYAEVHHLSIEMAARDLRYEWFEQTRQKYNCAAIAVAHHQNDQAETLMLNLKRGTGIRGLQGMLPKNGYIIRPLLCTTRDYIEHYCKIRHLDYVIDSTNADTKYKRNAIREQLQAYSKAEIENLAATATRMQDYTIIIDHFVDIARKDVCNGNNIDIKKLLSYPAPKTLLFELIKEYGFKTTDEIYAAICKGEGGKTFTANGHTATIKRGKLIII